MRAIDPLKNHSSERRDLPASYSIADGVFEAMRVQGRLSI